MYRVELKGIFQFLGYLVFNLFLMYRVELKAGSPRVILMPERVPNVPCGVERLATGLRLKIFKQFLMYRVELKVLLNNARVSPMVICS